MYNDILGNEKEEKNPVTKDGIIDALKYNLKEKDHLIEKLVDEILRLEKKIIELEK